MSNKFPELIDPYHLVEKRAVFDGTIRLSEFSRLADMLSNNAGEAEIHLVFGKEDKIASLSGYVSTKLTLQCQVCLGPMHFSVRSEMKLGIVASIDEAELLPDGYEPLLVEGAKLSLKEIIEDELLLAVPYIPRHEQCEYRSATPSDREPRGDNPFEVLAALKTERRK